ncbi:hypothetical protein [Dyadobacter frigoris]|uniref:Uncharacterized protein n=1 Tax=Dyadobacter frigoris TaxID=2576211 RepID=A0A4U6CRF0_9BACT|nr:hypothetical protein [Dyadobacter frigoris]TKT86235.1 hypothetical protein FDK13_32490 [Dyadobacter frigoris]
MKNSKSILFATGIFTMSLIMSCGDASKKDMKDADKNLKEANKDLKEAAVDANDEAKLKAKSDWQNFKMESDSEIVAMQNQTTRFKEKIQKANKKEKIKLTADLKNVEQKLDSQKRKLETKNAEFEASIDKFDASVETKNESFQREFKHDMNELGGAVKDLFKDNVK